MLQNVDFGNSSPRSTTTSVILTHFTRLTLTPKFILIFLLRENIPRTPLSVLEITEVGLG